jgi:hypothetical protein
MNFRTTWTLLLVTLAVLVGIIFIERPLRVARSQPADQRLLGDLKPSTVLSVQIRPAGSPEIRLERTNGGWQLTRPLAYPADPDRVERLLQALAQITWLTHIGAQELRQRPKAQEEFGFVSPQVSIVIEQTEGRHHLLVGARNAVANELFVQVVGGDGFYLVTDVLLKFVPPRAGDWRDRKVLDLAGSSFDLVRARSGTKGYDLQREGTNQSWKMSWPLQSRADNSRIDSLLQRLPALRVAEFVSDDARADLDSYGLQSPELELSFFRGTNFFTGLQLGRSPTNDPALVYARRTGTPHVFLIARGPLEPWRSEPADFRDRHIVRLGSNEVSSIDIRGSDKFTVSRVSNDTWKVLAASPFEADPTLVIDLLGLLSGSEVEFGPAVVTDFAGYGLGAPVVDYTLKRANGSVVAQILFGTNQAGKAFVRRADETSVDSIKPEEFQRLPLASWQLRDRRLWSFDPTNVAGILISQKGRSMQLLRAARGEWAVAPGSEGFVNAFSLDETLHRLGEMRAVFWVARGDDSANEFGFRETDHHVTFSFRNGAAKGLPASLTLDFGRLSEYGNPYAAAPVGGERMIFEFPWPFYFDQVKRDLSVQAVHHP